MKPAALLKLLVFALTLILSVGPVRAAEACAFNQKISYPDTSTGCITDLPLAEIYPKTWARKLGEAVRTSAYYSVAVSATCPEVGLSATANPLLKDPLDNSAIGACAPGCDCQVIIKDGRVLVPKDVIMRMPPPGAAPATTPSGNSGEQGVRTTSTDLRKLLSGGTDAGACAVSQRIKWADGTAGCITDLPMAEKVPVNWTRKLADAVRNSPYYSIAASRLCPSVSMAATDNSLLKGPLDNSAIGSCPSECDCRVVVRDGNVLVPREVAMGIGATSAPVQDRLPEPPRAGAQRPAADVPRPMPVAPPSAVAAIVLPVPQLRPEPTKGTVMPATVYANRKALVIGNNAYRHVLPLANARADATAIAAGFAKVGYQVTLKLDLNERDMKATLRQFKNQVEPGDEVAIFYAGHGVQLSSQNFLIPVDVAGEGEEQIKDEAVSLQRILDDMSDRKVKFTLAMIDACRDNPFRNSNRALNSRGLVPTTAASGQMIVFSAGSGQQALDNLGPNDKDRNGVFTRVFVREMEKKGVTVDRVVRAVRQEVVRLARSVGHDQVPAIYDQVVGDFYFAQ